MVHPDNPERGIENGYADHGTVEYVVCQGTIFFLTFTQRGLNLPAERNILEDTVGSLETIHIIALNSSVEKYQNGGAILFDHLEFNPQDFSNGLEPGEILLEMIPPVRMQDVSKVAADQLITGITQYMKKCLVDIQEIALLVQGLVRHGGIHEHLPKSFFIISQHLFGMTVSGNILSKNRHPTHGAAVIPQGMKVVTDHAPIQAILKFERLARFDNPGQDGSSGCGDIRGEKIEKQPANHRFRLETEAGGANPVAGNNQTCGIDQKCRFRSGVDHGRQIGLALSQLAGALFQQ